MEKLSENTATINSIEEKIQNIDVEIFRLRKQKRELEIQKEKLKEKNFAEKSLALSNKNWTDDFPWSPDIQKHLKQTFGFDKFKECQLKAINAILSRNNVLLVAPTSAGKSLCYQLPACATSGLTLVISPLIALMENQMWNMRKLGIKVEVLTQSTEKSDTQRILRQLADQSGDVALKLLYVAPERLAKSKRFMSALQKCYFAKKLDRIAVDEVHCCSQWGHEFRTDYKFLGSLKTTFPDVPILGVTATATEKVITDVQKMLNIRECVVLKSPFNRSNLYYQVMEKPSEKKAVVELIAGLLKRRYNGKSGIIYTFSQKDTEELTAALIHQNCKVSPYHANLDAEVRSKVHENWLSGKIQAVVATVAFGMGIDKPDVRFVIHHSISRSIENYYQESGRAGRDGEYAECLVLYRFADLFKITTTMFAETMGLPNAYAMLQFCISGLQCRREIMSEHFAEDWKDDNCKKMCDRCLFRKRMTFPKINVARHLNDLLQIIDKADHMDMKLTGLKLVDAWYQKGPVYLRVAKLKPPSFDRSYAENIIANLILDEYLKEEFHYTAYSTNSYIKKGPKTYSNSEMLEINRTRYLDLPENYPPRDDQSDDDIILVSPSKRTPEKRHRTETISFSPTKKFRTGSNTPSSQESTDQMQVGSDSGDDVEVVNKVEEMPSFFIDLDDSLFE